MYGGSRQRVRNRDIEVTMVIPCQEGGRAKGERLRTPEKRICTLELAV